MKQEKNRATELIEDFMIAANEVVARMLEANKVSSIRRVVKTPGALAADCRARGEAGRPTSRRSGFQSAQ